MELNNLQKTYAVDNSQLLVFDNFSLTIPVGAIVALIGPSGCGKTTLLRIIGGLETADKGTVVCDKAEQGNVGYLFQEPRLLPWDSVYTNVEIVLRRWIVNKEERKKKALQVLSSVGLAEYIRFTPSALSGGMRQRVAIARAFAFPCNSMLLDEPFQSQDASLRSTLAQLYISLWRKERRTTVYVTHDIPEAILLADRIVKLSHRPMEIIEQFSIEIPQEERSLQDPYLLSLQAKLYT